MGIKIDWFPDVFQNVMSKLVQDMEYVKTYLYDLLILTNISFKDHLLKLEMVLARLMSKFVQDMEYVKIYLDDLLILTNSSFKDHLLKLEMVLARLSTAGMRVNISKSKLFAEQIE
jgi:hypothetical protein